MCPGSVGDVSLNIMVIYMYIAPGWGQTCPCGPFIQNHKSSVYLPISIKKVQVGKDQEKAQSEKDSHSKNRGGKKPN